MIYTVDEMAQKLGVPASTLRYYDKEGLLPFVERSSGGIRMFRETDFEWLQVIRCGLFWRRCKRQGMRIYSAAKSRCQAAHTSADGHITARIWAWRNRAVFYDTFTTS